MAVVDGRCERGDQTADESDGDVEASGRAGRSRIPSPPRFLAYIPIHPSPRRCRLEAASATLLPRMTQSLGAEPDPALLAVNSLSLSHIVPSSRPVLEERQESVRRSQWEKPRTATDEPVVRVEDDSDDCKGARQQGVRRLNESRLVAKQRAPADLRPQRRSLPAIAPESSVVAAVVAVWQVFIGFRSYVVLSPRAPHVTARSNRRPPADGQKTKRRVTTPTLFVLGLNEATQPPAGLRLARRPTDHQQRRPRAGSRKNCRLAARGVRQSDSRRDPTAPSTLPPPPGSVERECMECFSEKFAPDCGSFIVI
uniref:Uncharacterized protein n=1 Tax=Plectus sambesii TaxID=2011161 RepID=A0A914WMT4_9BILA